LVADPEVELGLAVLIDPDATADDPKRYLVAAKHNMAKLPRSLAYEIQACVASRQRPGEETANTSRLVYVCEADIAPYELFAPPESKQLTKQQQAAAVLDQLLTENEGVVSVHEYTARAQDETDASESTIGRAVSDLEVARFKLGDFEDKTWWIRRANIAQAEARKLAMGQTDETNSLPRRRDDLDASSSRKDVHAMGSTQLGMSSEG
jgi:hypothetical protein